MIDWREALLGDRAIPVRVVRRLVGIVREPVLRLRARGLARTLRCRGMLQLNPQNMDSGWTRRQTTPAELAVIEFLRRSALPQAPRILHVGIGTGELGRSLSSVGADVIGLSIHGGEIANARSGYRRIHLVDKYAETKLAVALEDAKFDWIVDVCPFSYACCWGHAIRFLWFLERRLMEGGTIVTHVSGTGYAPTGYMLTPSVLERVAGLAGLGVRAGPGGIVLLEKLGIRRGQRSPSEQRDALSSCGA